MDFFFYFYFFIYLFISYLEWSVFAQFFGQNLLRKCSDFIYFFSVYIIGDTADPLEHDMEKMKRFLLDGIVKREANNTLCNYGRVERMRRRREK